MLSFLLLLLAVLLSLPNLRLLHYIISNNQQPNVFDRGLALCLVTSGKWIEGRIMAHVSHGVFWRKRVRGMVNGCIRSRLFFGSV